MQPLRIVHITSAHKSSDIRIFQKECISLAKNGYDVYLVAPNTDSRVDRGVKIVGVNQVPGRFSRFLLTGIRVFRAAMSVKPDVCHIHDPELLVWVPLMKMLGKQVIYDMHENTPKSIISKPWIPLFARKFIASIFRCAERVLAHNTQVIFAETDYAASGDYAWIKDGEIVLNMPLADHLLAIEKPSYAEPTIAYLGAISGDRGAFNTVEALHILTQRGIRIKWLCIGPVDKEDITEMNRLIEQYSLHDQVEILGYTLPAKAWDMIAGCWAGLATLLPLPNYFNSYPTKIFEYMALGIPVIASDFPLYRDVVENSDCGICVNPEDPISIADSIQSLVKNTELRKQMGENGRKMVKCKYNWETQAEKLLAVYKKMELKVTAKHR